MIHYSGVKRPAAAFDEFKQFVNWLCVEMDVRHDISLCLVSSFQGAFDGPGCSPKGIEITVLLDGEEKETTAHEFVHYEQWRDNVNMTERGVDQRARALVKRYHEETGR